MQEALITVAKQILHFVSWAYPYILFGIAASVIIPNALSMDLDKRLKVIHQDSAKFEEDFLIKDNPKNSQIIRDIKEIKYIKKVKGLSLKPSKTPTTIDLLIETKHGGEHWFKVTGVFITNKMQILSFDRFT